ncbi:MAG TPA: Hsp70 family protein [Polyangiaceae bacterium]|nr:Hsp70 family protein [Polyangiaceae bacterium]
MIVGIDLGTTHSSIGYFDGREVTLVPNAAGDVLTPSAVSYHPKTFELLVGRAAKDIIALHPALGSTGFKRWMGTDMSVLLRGERWTAPELSACVLRTLRQDAERHLGARVERCVISVPAYFGEAQRHATRQAAELAGLSVERLVSEPTAAAIAHGIEHELSEDRFMVVDLGGGTFDVCIMEMFEGVLQVKGVAGDSQLGGDDFTRAIMELAAARAQLCDVELSAEGRAMLLRRAELAKRALTRWATADIDVPRPDGSVTTVTIAQADAASAFRPLVARMDRPCRTALSCAATSSAELDRVLFVGGAVRMPCISEWVRDRLAKEPTVEQNPDLTVTRGAALQAAMCARHSALEDRVVVDVCSHSLGVAVSRAVGNHITGDYFFPIIERNTVIPVARVERFSTVSNDQRAIVIEVYEGEARRTTDNRLLGELRLDGIGPGPSREVVAITFRYDVSGVLQVEAKDLETGALVSATLSRNADSSAAIDLHAARIRLAALELNAQDQCHFRDALLRAELLWEDLHGEDRERLEGSIRDFEASLTSGAPILIDRALRALEAVCHGLDAGQRW